MLSWFSSWTGSYALALLLYALIFKLLSMLYGAVILVDGGYESAEKAADNLRAVLTNEL